MKNRKTSRRGATAVEFAIVGSVTFMMLFGLFVGCMGVFRYQQVCALARDAARWASVHGTQYATDTSNTAATSTDVYNNGIVPYAQGLTLSKLTYSVSWNSSNSPYTTVTVSGVSVKKANTVSVTVNYQWLPEVFYKAGTLTSTATTFMTE